MLLPIYQVIAEHCLREAVVNFMYKLCHNKLEIFSMLLPIYQVIAEHCLREVVVNFMYKLCYNKLEIFNAATNISGYSRTLFERSCGQLYVQTLL